MYTVLGAKGFIGGRLVKALQREGIECFAPDRNDQTLYKKNLGTVFYCIGLTNDYKDRPFDTVEAHVCALNRLIRESKFDHLVYLSSTRLYDTYKEKVAKENTALSLNPENPRHIFDLSKALGENISLTASGNRATVVRLSSVYDSKDDATGFLPDLLRKLQKEKRFILDSATGISRDYIHIDDVVNGLMRIAETKEKTIINLASGQNVSNQYIVEIINKNGFDVQLKRQSEVESAPRIDITKLKKIGISPVQVDEFLNVFLKENNQ